MSVRPVLSALFSMRPKRRIEDQLRELCARAARASDPALPAIMSELEVVLNEYMRRVSNRNYANVLLWPKSPLERRKPAK